MEDIRSALEVLHDVQEFIIHIRSLRELHLDLIQVAQRVAPIEWTFGACKVKVAVGEQQCSMRAYRTVTVLCPCIVSLCLASRSFA